MNETGITQDNTLDRTKPPKAKPPKDVHFPDYYDTTLANGINLLVIENYKIPSVSIRFVFKDAGSYYDNGKYGVSSVTTDLLTKGTRNRTATQIAEETDFYGASLSAGDDWDGSYVSLTVLKKFLDKVTDVLADVVLNPVFAEEEINRLKEQRISSIIQGKDEPSVLSDKMFNKVVFEGSPYAFPPEGTEESIRSMTRDDIAGFYDEHYRPDKLILAFVGAISKEEAIKIVNEKFSVWEKKDVEPVNTEMRQSDQPPTFSTDRVYIVDKPSSVQSNLRIGHTGIARNNPDFIAVTVMNTILGGYFGSRINYDLREKHGFTYGARSSFSTRILPGDFSVDADVRNEVTDSSVERIIENLQSMTSEEVTDEELQTVKNYLTGLFPLQLETANAVATRVINLKLYGLPKNYYSTYISQINGLTKKDILDAAQKYIHPDKLFIVISGNANVIRDKMARFGKVEVYDADGKPEQK